jgi:protein-tyrosine phosphatase
MIDLHNHILPGVDDGAADMDESLAIARQFVEEGVVRVAATPHLDPENQRGISAADVRRLVNEVQAGISTAGIPLRVEPGHEVYLTPDVPDLVRAGRASRLGDGHALLVELSLMTQQRPLYLEESLFQLQLDGLQPVLAHPERYAFVQRDPTVVDPLIESGIVMQVTAPSLLGHYGGYIRRVAERLLRRGSYGLASSDRHHPGHERSLKDMHRRITDLTDPETADLLLRENPARLLDGADPLRPVVQIASDRSLFGKLWGRAEGTRDVRG